MKLSSLLECNKSHLNLFSFSDIYVRSNLFIFVFIYLSSPDQICIHFNGLTKSPFFLGIQFPNSVFENLVNELELAVEKEEYISVNPQSIMILQRIWDW